MVESRSHHIFAIVTTIFIVLSNLSTADALTYNVVSLGARADGQTECSQAFMAAWNQACQSNQPATIYVPSGRFYLSTVDFSGPCMNGAITMQIDGTLVAPSDYSVIGNSPNWVSFSQVDGVSISGGVLDAQGIGLWACKKSKQHCPTGATSLGISNSKNIMVTGLTSLHSQMFHVVINHCENVKLQGVSVSAPRGSPNTDGIHVQFSSAVTILESKIGTGDDCISIGPGTYNMWIENVLCGPGHGISIGSLGKNLREAGVQNVTVKTATFTGTQNGVRIKAWARPSNGFARDILFQDIIMVNVQNPIVIDEQYCPNNQGCPDQVSGVRISDVTYQDIRGTSATEVAVKFQCSSVNPCTGIRLEDVKLSYMDQQIAQVSCTHAGGQTAGVVQPSGCL